MILLVIIWNWYRKFCNYNEMSILIVSFVNLRRLLNSVVTCAVSVDWSNSLCFPICDLFFNSWRCYHILGTNTTPNWSFIYSIPTLNQPFYQPCTNYPLPTLNVPFTNPFPVLYLPFSYPLLTFYTIFIFLKFHVIIST